MTLNKEAAANAKPASQRRQTRARTMPLDTDDPETIYIIDRYCADRLRGLLEQLLEVFSEALARRRYDPPDPQEFGIEEADMLANVSSFKNLLDDTF
jgi:hypothetical protein